MTQEAQMEILRRKILNDANDTTKDVEISELLERAKNVFLNKVFPFARTKDEIPERYHLWQIDCAYELSKLDEEGGRYKSYSENGYSCSKDTDGISQSLLEELPFPQAGVPL